jgi:hypothetical protein
VVLNVARALISSNAVSGPQKRRWRLPDYFRIADNPPGKQLPAARNVTPTSCCKMCVYFAGFTATLISVAGPSSQFVMVGPAGT